MKYLQNDGNIEENVVQNRLHFADGFLYKITEVIKNE